MPSRGEDSKVISSLPREPGDDMTATQDPNGAARDPRRYRAEPNDARTTTRGKRRKETTPRDQEGVLLACVSRRVPPVFGADRPLVGALLAEDLCWSIACEDWRGRRPPMWKRAERKAWAVERKVLDAKRARLAEQATELGYAPILSEQRKLGSRRR
jgi:hypothetical protein